MKNKKEIYIIGFLIFILVAAYLSYRLFFYSQFPDDKEIEKLLMQIESPNSDSSRYIMLKEFMNNIRNPENVEQDYAVEKILNRLQTIYIGTHDNNILKAIDETPIAAGFANYVCEFYLDILEDDMGKLYYTKNPEPLERCVGLSLTEEMFNTIKQITEHAPSQGPLVPRGL